MHSEIPPWYKEPWPWILMAGPVIVVFAGVWTAWLAISTSDGLVDDDYYKQGLAINQSIHRDSVASEAALSAEIMLGVDQKQLRLVFKSSGALPMPEKLFLRLSHPTRAGFDQAIELKQQSDSLYVGYLATSLSGRWKLTLDDPSKAWRLLAEWRPGENAVIKMQPLDSVLPKKDV